MAEEKLYLDEKGYQQYLAEIEELKRQLQENSRSKTSSYNSAVANGDIVITNNGEDQIRGNALSDSLLEYIK